MVISGFGGVEGGWHSDRGRITAAGVFLTFREIVGAE